MAIIFHKNEAGVEEIVSHFNSCAPEFLQGIKKQTSIENYSQKIHSLARRFEAWDGENLVGLVAAYYNAKLQKAFITNVSILPLYQSRGIGSHLLKWCIENLFLLGAVDIGLEVLNDNERAKRLYASHGFFPLSRNDNSMYMICYYNKD